MEQAAPSRQHKQISWQTYQQNYSQRPSHADGRLPCINGDIAIQWEWPNFDPLQNQNPLTDYDKTLHNWLSPRDEHVTQNFCQSTLRSLGVQMYVQ